MTERHTCNIFFKMFTLTVALATVNANVLKLSIAIATDSVNTISCLPKIFSIVFLQI